MSCSSEGGTEAHGISRGSRLKPGVRRTSEDDAHRARREAMMARFSAVALALLVSGAPNVVA